MLKPATLLTLSFWMTACTITPLDTQLSSGMAYSQTGGGIGGTGITCSASGFGISALDGAGIACLINTGGIGGTGLTDWSGGIGGTGVVGTITGFGSLIINGLHVNFEPDQKVESLLGGVTGQDLHIGQVVAVQANNLGQGLVAQRIVLQTALVGQVEAINRDKSEVVVAGERVIILPNLSNLDFSLEQLQVGDTLAISGVRTSANLYASHLTQAFGNNIVKGNAALVSGVITNIHNTQLTLDNSRIITLPASEVAKWTTGDFVSVEVGSSNSQRQNKSKAQAQSKRVKKWYGILFDGQVQRLAVESVTAGSEVVDLKRKVQFFSRDKENKMRLEGSLQTKAEAWLRPSVKQLKPRAGHWQLGVEAKAMVKTNNGKDAAKGNSARGAEKNNAGGGGKKKK